MTPGEQFGPYELLAPIGAGGMGEVWKARDTRLERIVAVKFSKEQFTARFEREARAIAQLNHPNICTLHDVGPNYLVMEYVEGAPIKGPLDPAKLIEVAGQICDALDAAHRKGITHRDLKPANVLATRQGIKLLDFGLAKMPSEEPAPPLDGRTITEALTGRGVVLGTPQYMAPEQIEGKAADARSDIFALGCVLYELVKGKRAFEGPTTSSVAAAILAREPEPLQAPPMIERVIRTCLAKDPEDRYQNARDVKLALELASAGVPEAPKHRKPSIWIAAAVSCLITGYLAGWKWGSQPEAVLETSKFEIPAPLDGNFSASMVAVSADGRQLVFPASSKSQSRRLWLRSLDNLTPRPLPQTEDATFPMLSPDGKWVAFMVGSRMMKLPLDGGAAQAVTDALISGGSGSWNKEGVIIYFSDGRLFRVSADGGTPVLLEKGIRPRAGFPRFLPDGNRFIYRVGTGSERGTFVGALDGSVSKKILPEAVHFAFDRGYLFMASGGLLQARAFDPDRLEFSGETFTLSKSDNAGMFGAAGGTLAFFEIERRSGLKLLERSGREVASFGQSDGSVFSHMEISRDGKRIFADRSIGDAIDIWSIDTTRGSVSRVTFDRSSIPLESPDGAVLYAMCGTRPGICRLPASGNGKTEVIWSGNSHHMSISPDGKHLAFESGTLESSDINLLTLGARAEAIPLLNAPYSESDPQFSPDGKWLAYMSNETGRAEVYVQSFPLSSRKWQVSTKGGMIPRWRGDTREMFFEAAGHMVSVPVSDNPSGLAFGAEQALFPVESMRRTDRFAVSADGQRFAVNVREAGSRSAIVVIRNWRRSQPER